MPIVKAIVLLTIATVTGVAIAPDAQQKLKVCVESAAAAPSLLAQAQAIASRILASAGLHIAWRSGRPACDTSNKEAIVVRFSEESLREQQGTLAYARPAAASEGGVQVVVYYQRILKVVESRRWPSLLGHVLAHEIAHILEGVDRHSDWGIMKARWDETDFIEMSWRLLPLTPEDVELINRGLDLRASRTSR
jgi:hypothetical protein